MLTEYEGPTTFPSFTLFRVSDVLIPKNTTLLMLSSINQLQNNFCQQMTLSWNVPYSNLSYLFFGPSCLLSVLTVKWCDAAFRYMRTIIFQIHSRAYLQWSHFISFVTSNWQSMIIDEHEKGITRRLWYARWNIISVAARHQMFTVLHKTVLCLLTHHIMNANGDMEV